MADNIFEQLVKENKDSLISESSNLSLREQEKRARRSSSKIQKNINQIKVKTNQAVDFIVGEKNKITIPVIDKNEEIFKQAHLQNFQSTQSVILESEDQNIFQNTASRIDYAITQKIEETIAASSALDNYRYKKDPTLFSKEHDMSEVILEVVDRSAANINYIANASVNKQTNDQQAKNLLK